MLLIARKNLFSERVRLAIAVGGVALAVLLISLLLSLYRGWNERVGGFVEDVDADIWVAREGTVDFLSAASVLPLEEGQAKLSQAELYVERSSPLVVRPMSALKGSKELDIELIGYDTQTGIGGPLKIKEGKSTPGPNEVIVDEAMKRRFGVKIGDTLTASGTDLKVVGISSGGDFVAVQIVFVTLDTAIDTLELKLAGERFVTFFLLKLKDPSKAEALARQIEQQQPGIVAITSEEFAANTRHRLLSQIVPVITVVLGLSFIVGLAISGLTIYTATVEKAREYGILKAVGFNNTYLYRLVFEQSMVTAFLGFVIGVGITLLAAPIAQDYVAQFIVYIRWQDMLGVAGITFLMALLAAYIPVRRLAAIDPVAVFKA